MNEKINAFNKKMQKRVKFFRITGELNMFYRYVDVDYNENLKKQGFDEEDRETNVWFDHLNNFGLVDKEMVVVTCEFESIHDLEVDYNPVLEVWYVTPQIYGKNCVVESKLDV